MNVYVVRPFGDTPLLPLRAISALRMRSGPQNLSPIPVDVGRLYDRSTRLVHAGA
jgi:hypothetical protein